MRFLGAPGMACRDQVILDDHNRPIVLLEKIDDKKRHDILKQK